MRIHFIGIGGIGISALGQYYLKTGHKVSGSDLASSETTDFLKKMGAKIIIGPHKAKNVSKNIDLVIYSPAVQPDNPELLKAKSYNLKAKSYPEVLGELTKQYFTIAVSGSHGKSTTTALISVILMKAGLDPTVIIGTKLKEFSNSNFRFGGFPKSKILNLKSKILVIEADEYKGSFLNYWPKIIVLTNLEYEHPDYFKNFQHYLRVFKEYLSHLLQNGCKDGCKAKLYNRKLCNQRALVVNKDDKNIRNVTNPPSLKLRRTSVTKICYSLSQKESQKLRKILKIPGKHNISNALAALTVARLLKIPDKISFKALSEYRGAWRRFEEIEYKIQDTRYKILVISDYAHHPTQVKATIAAAREKYPKKKIWAVFQPHQYLRTHYLFKDYVKAFDGADEVVLPEIYAVSGRENKEIIRKLSSKDLVLAIQKRFKRIKKEVQVHFLEDYRKIPDFLKSRVKNGDVVLLMGAGNIYKLISYPQILP